MKGPRERGCSQHPDPPRGMANLSEQADMGNVTGPSRRQRPRTAESLAAEAQFRQLLDTAGAELLEPEFLGVLKKHRVRCRAGHLCTPRPADARRNGTICITCAGRDPRAVEADFRARLAELGCTPVYEKYLGRNNPHAVLCPAGHKCFPRPGQLRLGRGPCRICAGLDSATAEVAFRAAMAAFGAQILGEYKNAHTKVRARCPAGHECHPTPHALQQGRGICGKCAGKDPDVMEARFLARLAELGATPLYDQWRSVSRGHRVRCAAGHESYPRPADVHRGDGICVTCAGKDPRVAEAAFRVRLAELGAELLEPYVNSKTAPRVRCAEGHECRPAPGYVVAGGGICQICAGDWDVFYVVTGKPGVKFGITTGDPRIRLRVHAVAGYADVVRLATGLPGTTAIDTENAVRFALAAAGRLPVRGREYFEISCLSLILAVADSRLTLATAPAAPADWMQGTLFAA